METEAYPGGEDKASHSAGGKRTERNTAMFMEPGTIYVYPIYGIYLCMNVSSEGKSITQQECSFWPLMHANRRNVIKPFYVLHALFQGFIINKTLNQYSGVFCCQWVKGKMKETEWSLAE